MGQLCESRQAPEQCREDHGSIGPGGCMARQRKESAGLSALPLRAGSGQWPREQLEVLVRFTQHMHSALDLLLITVTPLGGAYQ